MIYDLQKGSLIKRISAFLLDFVLIAIIATFFAWIVSLITNYSSILQEFNGHYARYEAMYGISLTDPKLFETYTEEQLATYKDAINAMNADPEVIKCWGLVSNLPVIMVSVGFLMACLIVEFIVPIIFKNGQTVGKKVFKLGVINENGVICTKFQMFARAILGKYTIEYMIPGIIIVMMGLGTIGFIGPIILLAIIGTNIGVVIANPNRPFIHDLVARTVVCDLSTQKTFQTYEEMIAYREQIDKEIAERSVY
ncbi:MAG: RDD family protein [Bacilli bacterium]|nr:RDD family protein [Bacilli bacterium]